MASKYDVHAEYAIAYPSNVVAQKYGAHIQSVVCTDLLENGCLVALGQFEDLDVYKDDGTFPTDFEAEIVKKAQNGNWYVRVKNPGSAPHGAYLVYTVPIVPEEWTNRFKSEARFFNAKGELARVYQLTADDVFEASDLAFDGTPAVGAIITTTNAQHKMKI